MRKLRIPRNFSLISLSEFSSMKIPFPAEETDQTFNFPIGILFEKSQ